MKKLILALLLAAAATASTFGQGTVTFGNTSGLFATPADRLVYYLTDPIKGTQWRAQLYWSATSSGTLLAVDSNPASFRSTSTSLAGTWVQQEKIVPATQGSTVFLQVRVWDSSSGGATYETAGMKGGSDLFTWRVPATGDPANAQVMENFRAFAIMPEPSTFALAGMGILGLIVARRRK